MDKEYIGKINVIDAIIVGIIFFCIAGKTFDGLSFIIKIIMAVIIGMAYYTLVKMRYIGVILPFIGSLVWTLMLIVLLPISLLTKDNMIWNILIAIPLFVFFFKLHVRSIRDFFKNIPEMFSIKIASVHSEKQSTATEDEEALNSYQSAKQIYTDFKAFINANNEIVSAYFPESSKSINDADRIVTTTDILTNKKRLRSKDIQKIIEQTKGLYEINETLRIVCYHTSERIRNQRSNYGRNSSSFNSSNDIDESLFSGCTDQDSLTKRYRQLMKTFHPDNQNGDQAMTQKIQRTYEYMGKRYGL